VGGPLLIAPVFAGGDVVEREESGGVITGLAHVLLEKALLVGTALLDEVEVIGFIHLLAWIFRGELLLEFVEEPLIEGVLEIDGVQREAFGVAVVLNLLDKFVEVVVGAAMGGEDFERAAPGNAGVSDGVELLGIGMEGEFVEDAVAAFAGVRVGSAGHGVDVQFVGQSEDVGGMALVID